MWDVVMGKEAIGAVHKGRPQKMTIFLPPTPLSEFDHPLPHPVYGRPHPLTSKMLNS